MYSYKRSPYRRSSYRRSPYRRRPYIGGATATGEKDLIFKGPKGTFGQIYFYENANKVNKAFFEDEAAGQYWKDSCIKGNVGLISKGNNACKILETLK